MTNTCVRGRCLRFGDGMPDVRPVPASAEEFAHTKSSSQKHDIDEQLNDVSMAAQAETDAAADALDAVLDDIESTLESNAEEYVNSFVQKGGE